MKKRKLNRSRVISLIAALSLFLSGTVRMPEAHAEIKKDFGISYYDYTVKEKNKIDDSTLFIGTYLIYMGAITGSFYQDAMASRVQYEQSNMYYKTEVSDGAWRDIEGAESISTIAPGGRDIEESELYDLRITCVIGKDGKPKSTTGDLLEDPDPYDPGSYTGDEKIIIDFDPESVKDEETDKMDEAIKQGGEKFELQDTPQKRDAVYEVMTDADNTRRSIVAKKILDGATKRAGGKDNESDEGIGELKEKYADYSAKKLVPGNTGLSIFKYNKKMEIIDNKNTDRAIADLAIANELDNGDSRDRPRAYSILTGPVIKKQNEIVRKLWVEGVPEGYQDLKTKDEKKKMLEGQKSTDDNGVQELEWYVEMSVKMAASTEKQLSVVDSQLSWVKNQKKDIKKDDYEPYAKKSRQGYEDWLTRVKKKLSDREKGIEDDDNIQDLHKKLTNYRKEREKAVSRNDLKKAREYSFEMDRLEKDLKKYEEQAAKGEERPVSTSDDPSGEEGDSLMDLIGDFDKMDPQEKAAAVCALNQFGRERKQEESLTLARQLLSEIMRENNPLVYTKYQLDPNEEYVSMGAMDRSRRYTRYRYVVDNMEVTMSRIDAGISYTYELGEATYRTSGNDRGELTGPVVTQADPYIRRMNNVRYAYIREADASVRLFCRAEYIVDVDQAICVTQQMEPKITSIYKKLESTLSKK